MENYFLTYETIIPHELIYLLNMAGDTYEWTILNAAASKTASIAGFIELSYPSYGEMVVLRKAGSHSYMIMFCNIKIQIDSLWIAIGHLGI